MNSISPRHLLPAIVLLAFMSSLLPLTVAQTLVHIPREIVRVALSPVTGAIHSFSISVWPENRQQLDNPSPELQREYNLMMIELAKLKAENKLLGEHISQVTRSREVKDLEGYRFQPARVTAYSSDPPRLTISRGSRYALKNNQAVVSGHHLIGVIDQAGPFTANVKLVIAEQSVLVHIVPSEPTDSPRMLEDFIRRTADGQTFTCRISINDDVRIGDLARLADAAWPPTAHQFVVGQVEHIVEDEQDPLMFKNVRIRPGISFRRLRDVSVLIPQN